MICLSVYTSYNIRVKKKKVKRLKIQMTEETIKVQGTGLDGVGRLTWRAGLCTTEGTPPLLKPEKREGKCMWMQMKRK